MSGNKSSTRSFTYWHVISWLIFIPSSIYFISLLCYAPTSFSDTRNDAMDWMSVIGIGLLTLNAIYLSILTITFGRINISPWLTKAIAIFTLFLSIIFGLFAIIVWFLSVFYPHIVLYFGEDPKGMPAFTFAMFLYLLLLIALSIHAYKTHSRHGSEIKAT